MEAVKIRPASAYGDTQSAVSNGDVGKDQVVGIEDEYGIRRLGIECRRLAAVARTAGAEGKGGVACQGVVIRAVLAVDINVVLAAGHIG